MRKSEGTHLRTPKSPVISCKKILNSGHCEWYQAPCQLNCIQEERITRTSNIFFLRPSSHGRRNLKEAFEWRYQLSDSRLDLEQVGNEARKMMDVGCAGREGYRPYQTITCSILKCPTPRFPRAPDLPHDPCDPKSRAPRNVIDREIYGYRAACRCYIAVPW